MSSALPPEPRAELRGRLRDAFAACRAGTLALYEDVSEESFRTQIHPDFSPLGWHLGHIAYTEALWLVSRCGGRSLPRPELEETFHVEGLPKQERNRIPGPDTVRDYAEAVRGEMLDCLDAAPVDEQERLWRFVLQHESQHAETVSLLRMLRDWPAKNGGVQPRHAAATAADLAFLVLPGGAVWIGNDGADALDNEGPRHRIEIPPFEIGAHPVTQAQFAVFMADGGYGWPEFWSEAGWAWRSEEDVRSPLYWNADAPDHPVCGVSAHEADAFCRWAGVRLPSEFEWEAAATVGADDAPPSCDGAGGGTRAIAWTGGGPADMLGNVWEWTASVFAPYPDFDAFPYPGYSQDYFDGAHRVLRGGSWATRRWALRPSFRNWYPRETRQILAGFRCARILGG